MVDLAYAMAPTPNSSGASTLPTVLMIASMCAIFYFLLIRPQQRQKKEREATLGAVKKGDRVVTTSGVHGTVVGLNDNTMTLKIADQVRVDFDRSALGRIVPAQGEKESGA